MAKQAHETIERWMPTTLSELRDALNEMMTEAGCEGHDADTVYLDVRDFTLSKQTLTDGSVVLNVTVRENK